MRKLKAGDFVGSYYARGKKTDKWGNKYKTPIVLRQRHTGYIVTKDGKFIGVERPLHNRYGKDIHIIKKPVKFKKPF